MPESDTNERNFELLLETSSGEKVYRNDDTIIVRLPPNRNCVSTSRVNGGYSENLEAVFNRGPGSRKVHTDRKGHSARNLEGGSVGSSMKIHATRLGLNPDKIAAMGTAARMKNAAIATRSFRTLEVTAIVTAGIKVNGGRAGDPARWHEEDGESVFVGTINTIVLINSRMPPGTLTRVIMTATEAKTVAIQQLMAPSRYSTGVATGSGTDQMCVISNMDSPHVITWAGKHSKVGELIANCVIEATTKALELQTGLSPESQRDMLVRLDRFRIDEDQYWDAASLFEGEIEQEPFIQALRVFSQNPEVVAMTASILHICDEIEWGLVPEHAGKKAALSMMKSLPEIAGTPLIPAWDTVLDEKKSILENWIRLSAWCVKNTCEDSS